MRFNQKKDDTKKNQIFEATFKCIYEQGLQAVTLRSIAEKANLSQGLLHYYFKSKKRLLTEFVQILLDRRIISLEEKLEPSYRAKKKLAIYFKEGQEFVEKHGELMIVLQEMWSLSTRDSAVKKIFVDYVGKLATIMEGILEQGEKEKTFNKVRKDSYSLHIMYHAFVLGMGLLWQWDHDILDLKPFDFIRKNMEKVILKNS